MVKKVERNLFRDTHILYEVLMGSIVFVLSSREVKHPPLIYPRF